MFNFLKRTPRVRAQNIDAETIRKIITDKKPAIVVCMTSWCDACRMQKPLIHDLAHHHQEKDLIIGLVNIDHETSIRDHFEVRSIPTTLGFKNGELVFRRAGIMSRGQLEQLVSELSQEVIVGSAPNTK